MVFKQSTFEEIVESEKELFLTANNRYGAYYTNALNFNILLNNFVKTVDPDRYIFVMFLSQIRKHSTLTLFSIVRLHHIQAMMDLRQVLEAATCASYAIANTEQRDFADIGENGILDSTQDLAKKRYAWLKDEYPKCSETIHNFKKIINSSASHSNIIYAHNNFKLGDHGFETPFFDIEDEYLVKSNLWMLGNIIMGITDLFYGITKDYKGVTFSDDFIDRLHALEKENHRLKAELMSTERFKKSIKK